LIQPDGSGGGSLARRQVCSIAVRPGGGHCAAASARCVSGA